jgi:hypothetical protein
MWFGKPNDVSGYVVRHSPTFNIFLGARLTDEDPASANETLAQLKMYPYAQRDNPPPMDILDVGTRAWGVAPPRGMEYWQRLDDVIQREPVEPRDIFFHAMLRPLGLGRSSRTPARRRSWPASPASHSGPWMRGPWYKSHEPWLQDTSCKWLGGRDSVFLAARVACRGMTREPGRAANERATEESERRWLGVRDDFRNWLMRAA